MCIIILDRGGTQGVVAFDLGVPVMIMYNIYSHIKINSNGMQYTRHEMCPASGSLGVSPSPSRGEGSLPLRS